MIEIDDIIMQLERLYVVLRGAPPGVTTAPYAPIPPERDPVCHVEEQIDRLIRALPVRTPPFGIEENEAEYIVYLEVSGAREGPKGVVPAVAARVHEGVLEIRIPKSTDVAGRIRSIPATTNSSTRKER